MRRRLLSRLADEARHIAAGHRPVVADAVCDDCGGELEQTFVGAWCRACNVVDPGKRGAPVRWKP